MDNLRGSLMMVAAMVGFALEDMLVKQMAAALPMGQIIALLGVGGSVIFAVLARRRGERVWSPVLFSRAVVLRNVGEMIGTAGYVAAFVLTTLSGASAILQAMPLAVTLGAALFLGEPVGWRRWSAIVIGFMGVLLIIQPGLAGFAPASLFAVVGVAGLALRDLAVRTIPASVSGAQLSIWGFAAIIPVGLAMMLLLGTPPVLPGALDGARLLAAFVAGGLGYYAIVAATRTGDVAVVVPYRYTRLVFAMIIGALVFGERPGTPTLCGAGLIVGAGLYMMWRETRSPRRSMPETAD